MRLTMRSVLRQCLVWIVMGFAFGAACATADTAEPIVVVSVQGEVKVAMNGVSKAIKPGTQIELPATVSTGKAASLALRQGPTDITVAADTRMEIPATAVRGDLI